MEGTSDDAWGHSGVKGIGLGHSGVGFLMEIGWWDWIHPLIIWGLCGLLILLVLLFDFPPLLLCGGSIYILSSSSWLRIYPNFYEPTHVALTILIFCKQIHKPNHADVRGVSLAPPCILNTDMVLNWVYRKLEGSCQCGGVEFTLQSQTPVPYQLCACSICRKIGGHIGAVNLGGIADSLKISKGKDLIKYDPSIPTHSHFWGQDPPRNCHFIHWNRQPVTIT